MNSLSWKEAFLNGPGPVKKKEYLYLFLKAFCMGIADLIPGVSGGTIAFITGIYTDLLAAVSSINKEFLKSIISLDLKKAVSIVHIRFLIPLGVGVLSAIFILARLMHYLMAEHTVLTWSLFFGLIGASTLIIFKQLENPRKLSNILPLTVGVIFAWLMVSLIPTTTPEQSWFIYLCGVIGISAMLLPGLSGSFLLLILGKYEYITGAVKSPFVGDNFIVLMTFVAGSLTGLLGFSRFLTWLLKKYNSQTMAFLTGILIGSIKKVWPWKEVLETTVVRGKTRILREVNIMPSEINGEVLSAIGLITMGFIIVLIVESFSSKKEVSI